jgi:hypothetical protein
MTRDYITQLHFLNMTYTIQRNAKHGHPQLVHDALGTEGDEGRLQRLLDQANVDDWYGDDGRHLGADNRGLALYWLDKRGRRVLRLPRKAGG